MAYNIFSSNSLSNFKQFSKTIVSRIPTVLFLLLLISIIISISIAVAMLFNTVIGAVIGFVIGAAINIAVFWFSDTLILKLLGAKPIESNDTKYKKINPMLIKLSNAAGLKTTPKLYFMNGPANAFATGRSHNHSAICVTSGILEAGLTDEELEAVLAHEMAHIANRDTLINTSALLLVSAIEITADYMFRSTFCYDKNSSSNSNSDNKGAMLSLIMFAGFYFLAPIVTLLSRLAISRACETRADCSGAEYCKKPRALISALEKISRRVNPDESKSSHIGDAVAALFIVNPLKGDLHADSNSQTKGAKGFWSKMWGTIVASLSTHPSLEQRRKCLETIAVRMESEAAASKAQSTASPTASQYTCQPTCSHKHTGFFANMFGFFGSSQVAQQPQQSDKLDASTQHKYA